MLSQKAKRYRRLLLIVGLLVPVALTVTLGVFAHRSRKALLHSAERVERTLQIKEQISRLLAAVLEMESGQRGFLVTGNEAYLEYYHQGARELPTVQAELRRLMVDSRAQAELASTQAPIEAKLKFMAETVNLAKTGRRPDAIKRVDTGEGKRLMDDVSQHLTKLTRMEEQLLRERQSDEAQHATRTELFTWILAVLASLAVAGAVWMLRRFQESQDYIRMCAFSRTLELGGKWISVEQFLEERYNAIVSHGISPEEAEKVFGSGRPPTDIKLAS